MYLSTKFRATFAILAATSSLAAAGASLAPAATAKPIAPGSGPRPGSSFTGRLDWKDTCLSLRELYHYDQDNDNQKNANQDYSAGQQANCDMSLW
jgi:hypothetical protein